MQFKAQTGGRKGVTILPVVCYLHCMSVCPTVCPWAYRARGQLRNAAALLLQPNHVRAQLGFAFELSQFRRGMHMSSKYFDVHWG